MIQAALIGLVSLTVLVAFLYVVVFEVRSYRRMKRASWDLENARPGLIDLRQRGGGVHDR